MLRRGASGNVVYGLQRTLRGLGAYDGLIDGQFGPVTEAAVSRWQRHIGVPPSGGWTRQTQQATVREFRRVNPAPNWEGFMDRRTVWPRVQPVEQPKQRGIR